MALSQRFLKLYWHRLILTAFKAFRKIKWAPMRAATNFRAYQKNGVYLPVLFMPISLT
jgi:hypothetical protein